MKLGMVLKKERERKEIPLDDAARNLGLPTATYSQLEDGSSPIEDWAPKLAEIAIKLSTPTSRLISQTGKASRMQQGDGCGQLIRTHRENSGLSREDLATKLGWSVEELTRIENGETPLEEYGPLMLRFAEMVGEPIFNFFYPCGLHFSELSDYP